MGVRDRPAVTAAQRLKMRNAHLGKVPWNKGKKCPQLSGPNQGSWKGGFTRCADCGIQTHSYKAARCKSCAMKVVRKGQRPSEIATRTSADLRRGQPSPTRGRKRPATSGVRCHLWRGGVTPAHERIRKSTEYKAWRRSVFERDGYQCTKCGASGIYLHADHIKSFARFPELRFEVSNGRALCVPCHKLTDSYLNRWFDASHD